MSISARDAWLTGVDQPTRKHANGSLHVVEHGRLNDCYNGRCDGEEQPYLFGPDLDVAITRLRAHDRAVDAGFTLAETIGLAILPSYSGRRGMGAAWVNPLLGLSMNGGDEDWIVISPDGEHPDADQFAYTASMVADRLTVSDSIVYLTPSWRIQITCHA